MKKTILFILFFAFSFCPLRAQLPNYEIISINIPYIGTCADFDNSGTLDIIGLNGMKDWIYKDNQTMLPLVYTSSNYTISYYFDVLTDIDNDNDVDGIGITEAGLELIENKGNNTFVHTHLIEIPSSALGIPAVQVLDIDNDGKKEILVVDKSFDIKNAKTMILKNNGNNTFSIKATFLNTFVDLYQSAAFDYDGDGKFDIFAIENGTDYILLKNKGSLQFAKQTITKELYDKYRGRKYDFNADGKIDILDLNNVYLNNGNDDFNKINISLYNNWDGNRNVVVDMNSDGYLDIFGSDSIYLNTQKNGFRSYPKTSIGFTSLFGDLDNDGRMDIMLDGKNFSKNNSSPQNTRPTAPANLKAVWQGDSIVFNWDRATDNETPTLGLTYNLRIGTTSGKADVMSALARSDGKRLIVEQGNIMQNLQWTLKEAQGTIYYWTVQAIDNSFEGSTFAPEQVVFRLTNKITPPTETRLQINTQTSLMVSDNLPVNSHQWKVGTQEGIYQDVVGATEVNYVTSFNQAGTYYVVCESKKNTSTVISNVVKINVFAPEIAISGSIPTCYISRQKGTNFTLNYNLIGSYQVGNQFTAYLIDNLGNETTLNSLVSKVNGIFTVNIPAGVANGSNYKIRLKSSNPQVISNTTEQFTIDLNDAPYDILVSNDTIEENQPIGTVVGTLQAQDFDKEDKFTYTLLTNTTNFIIDGNTLKTNRIFDYEIENKIYTFAIKVTDNHNTSCIQTFNIFIDNVNEPPTLDLPSQTFAGSELGDISVNGFIINDVDVFDKILNVTVSSNDGILKLNKVSDKPSANLQFEGTLTQLNEIINSLVFKSKRYFYGNAQVKITVSDLGSTGLGGAKVVEKTLQIGVIPLPPEIIVQPVPLIKGCVNDRAMFSICADGVQPIVYQWYKEESILYSEKNNSISIAIKDDENAGSYYCKVKNAGGEVVSDKGVLMVKVQNFVAKLENVKLCSGDSVGEISVTATGGWGNYTYSIDNKTFTTTNNFQKLVGGTYTISVKDSNNCITQKDFVVETPPLLRPNVSQKNISCKDYKNGELLINVLGGTPPFSIDIQSSSINETLNLNSNSSQKFYKNLIPAIYNISIKDKNACDTFAVIRLTEPDKLSFASKSKPVNCFGEHNGELNFTLNGGTEPYWLYWSNNQMTNLIKDFKSGSYNLSEIAKAGLMAGTYDFYIVDSQHCETSENVEIESPKPLEISFVDNTLLAKGGTLPYEYSENGRSFSTTNTFPNLESGLHTLTIKDGRACMNSISQYIENKIVSVKKPSVDFSFSSQNLNVDLSSSIKNAKNWLWDFGDGTFSSEDINHHTYSKSGTYKITLTAYNESSSTVIEKTIQIIATNINTEIESDFTIYPNPATDEVFICGNVDNLLIITIFDTSGRKVLATKNLHFSVKDLAKGFYVIQVKTENGISTKSLIIR